MGANAGKGVGPLSGFRAGGGGGLVSCGRQRGSGPAAGGSSGRCCSCRGEREKGIPPGSGAHADALALHNPQLTATVACLQHFQ
jgi:hypothetical protein